MGFSVPMVGGLQAANPCGQVPIAFPAMLLSKKRMLPSI